MKTLRYFLLFIFLINTSFSTALASVPPAVAPAEGKQAPLSMQHQKPAGRVIVVLADRTGIDDWENLSAPNLRKLAGKYAVGLMNGKTGGDIIPENTHLTMGSGVPLRAPGTSASSFSEKGFFRKKQVRNIYRQRTGSYPPTGSVIQTDIAKIYRFNEAGTHINRPGTLGRILNVGGIQTCVLGNSDSILGLRRPAVLMGMDDRGIVDTGAVGNETLLKDPNFPGGYRTDYDSLINKYRALAGKTGVVIFELGDFSRIEAAQSYLFKSLIPGLRQQSMTRLDVFLGRLLNYVDLNRDLLIVVSPTPGGETVRGENMVTPVLLAGNGVKEGLLYSPATKRPGIIRNTDLLPTILKFMELDIPTGITGQPLRVMPGEYSFSALADLHKELVLIYHERRPVLQGYVFIQLVLLAASLIIIFWKKESGTKILQPVILAVMSFPAATLLLPLLLKGRSEIFLVITLLGIVLFLTLISTLSGRLGEPMPFVIISGLTSLLILTDLLAGAPLQKCSLFGYDPIVGARFYGLGNEFMGVLIGSTVVFISSLFMSGRIKKYRRLLLAPAGLYFVAIAYIIAAPNLGTNVGGTIASVGAFAVTIMLLAGIRIRPRIIAGICIAIATVVTGFILFDLNRPAYLQSHIGRTAALILAGGADEIVNIISRKLAMNIKLIRYTIWSRVFLASLGCLALLFYRPSGIMQMIRQKYPYLYKGFAGAIVGSILALAFNDSGVVAAATTMIFTVHPMLYLICKEISGKEG